MQLYTDIVLFVGGVQFGKKQMCLEVIIVRTVVREWTRCAMSVFEYWCGNCQIRIYYRRHYNKDIDWQDCPYICEYATAMRNSIRKDDLEIVHSENCKYEDTGGGMTNRQYLATLSNEELSNVIYDVIVDRIGHRYSSSREGVSQWLGELYREDDFIKGFAYYTADEEEE